MLDVRRLRVFRAVAASGSVQAAALNLGYTSSAISQQLGALQKETGLTLVQRSGRGITLTAAGRVLAAESEELMGSLGRLGTLVDDLREGRSTGLSINCFASAGQVWMPRVAKVLSREFPHALVTFNLNELADAPTRPDLDIRPEAMDAAPTRVPGYTRTVLHEEGYYVALPRRHPRAGDAEVSLASIAQEPWIDNDRSESTCSKILARACRAAGFSPRFVARCDDHYTAVAFVAAGVGVTALPQLALVKVPPQVVCARLVDPVPQRRIVAMVRDDLGSAPLAARALDLLREAAGSLEE